MSETAERITGSCLCGAIRFESSKPPFKVGYCHCRMCQKGLGNLFATAAFFSDAHFRFVSGEPTWYASSAAVKRGHCSTCGSPIAYRHRDADYIAIWLGIVDDVQAHEPQFHWYSDAKIPWVDIQPHLHDATTELTSYKAARATEGA